MQVIVGNTQGKMGLLDIRQGKVVHLYKGFAGGIRSVQCHASKPVVASCGLDRFLRVHDIESKALLSKVYMKSRLNCVAMTERWGDEKIETRASKSVDNGVGLTKDENDNDDIDDVWDNMEVVKTRTVKKLGQEDDDVTNSRQKKRKTEPRDSENNEILTHSKKLKQKTSRKKKKDKIEN